MNITIPATSDLTGAFGVHTPAPSTTNHNEPSRTEKLQQLFIANYGTIREAVSDAGPNLYVADIDNITAGIADHLEQFTGEPEDFLPWAVVLATESAGQAEAFYRMRSEHSSTVRKAIGSVLKGCDGLGVCGTTIDEIEADLWVKVLLELPAWLTEGFSNDTSRKPATLGTRLFAKSIWTAKAWKQTRVRAKERNADSEKIDLPSRRRGNKVECPVDY